MGPGGDQLHPPDVAADGLALRLDAAAVLLHSEAPQAHSCWEAAAKTLEQKLSTQGECEE